MQPDRGVRLGLPLPLRVGEPVRQVQWDRVVRPDPIPDPACESISTRLPRHSNMRIRWSRIFFQLFEWLWAATAGTQNEDADRATPFGGGTRSAASNLG